MAVQSFNFVAFTQAVRYLNHVSFLMNAREVDGGRPVTEGLVWRMMQRATASWSSGIKGLMLTFRAPRAPTARARPPLAPRHAAEPRRRVLAPAARAATHAHAARALLFAACVLWLFGAPWLLLGMCGLLLLLRHFDFGEFEPAGARSGDELVAAEEEDEEEEAGAEAGEAAAVVAAGTEMGALGDGAAVEGGDGAAEGGSHAAAASRQGLLSGPRSDETRHVWLLAAEARESLATR